MRNARVAVVSAACIFMAAGASAQTVVSAQSASISGASGKIAAVRVPVQVGKGAPSYFDVTINLAGTVVGGQVTGVKVTGTSTPSQIINSAGFVAGTYTDSVGNTYIVTGPGVAPPGGGATTWSFTSAVNDTCDSVAGATWYTDIGVNNPEYKRLKKTGITTTGYGAFGISGPSNGCFTQYNQFGTDGLIGVSQTGNAITFTSFSQDGQDYSTPTAVWTITLPQ